MMVQLTEDMIVARTRVSNMAMVKKLNCWGADLTDVSVVRRLQGVEVLSLSLNSLTSLSDFQCCQNLEELFVRKNKIQSLAELIWLRDLSRLKHLWLAENPCAEGNDRYRQTVIHNLPQLEKLDNVKITSEERADARFGINLEEKEEVVEDTLGERRISSKNLSSANDSDAYLETVGRYEEYEQDEEQHSQFYQENGHQMYRHSQHNQHGQDIGHQAAAYSRPCSRASYQPRYEEEGHVHRGQEFGVHRRERGRSYVEDGDSGCWEQYRAASMDRVDIPRTLSRIRVDMAMQQGRNRVDIQDMAMKITSRRRNRNSNMLSAILCLLNELDIPSLEVVEMAVRCRMQEMED